MLALPGSAFGFFETPNHSGHSAVGGYLGAAAGIIAVVGVGGMSLRNYLKSRRIRKAPGAVGHGSGAIGAVRAGALDRVPRQVSLDNSSDVAISGMVARPDVADELTKLANLRDRGALTQAEFDAQKDKLLGSE
jgi:hypothetical protein